MKGASKYRIVHCELVKGGTINGDGPVSLVPPTSLSSSQGIAASAEYLAAPIALAGHIAMFPTSSPSSSTTIAAHSKAITDLCFSPFDDSMLMTSSADGTVKSWKISEGVASLACSVETKLGASTGVIRTHRSADGILAVAGADGASLIDIATQIVVETLLFSLGSAVSLDWAIDGSCISMVCAGTKSGTGSLLFADLRANKEPSVVVPVDAKPQQVLSLRSDRILVLGQDQFRAPRAVMYDRRLMDKPLFIQGIQLSPGVCLPVYDADTSLMCLTTRGSNAMHVYDVSAADSIAQLTTFSSPVAFQGISSLPKNSCDFYGSEVLNVKQLSKSSIETISLGIPRKVRGFYPELYPDTASCKPALSAAEFLSGKIASPLLVPVSAIDKAPSATIPVHPAAICSYSSGLSSTARDAPLEGIESAADAMAQLDKNRSQGRRALEERLKKSVFAHVSGSEPRSLNAFWYGIKSGDPLSLGASIMATPTCIIVPWKTLAGSATAVLPINAPGRIEVNAPLIRAHGQQMSCFDVAQNNTMATGCVDAHVRMWNLPTKGLTSDMTEPRLDFITIGRVLNIAINPVAPNVVATASQSFDAVVVQIWNVASDTQAHCEIMVNEHSESVVDMTFRRDGRLLATTCKDRRCRVFDPRNSRTSIASFEIDEGIRDSRILWMGNTGHLLIVGFAQASSRQMSLWSVLDPNGSTNVISGGPVRVATYVIDNSNPTMLPFFDEDTNLLYLTSLGDRQVFFFEIDPSKGSDAIMAHGKYQCLSLVAGFTFLPKLSCDVRNIEIGRALRLSDDTIKPMTFSVPRKRKEFFQDDLFPNHVTYSELTASKWFAGEDSSSTIHNLCPKDMTPLSQAPAEDITERQKKRLEFKRTVAVEENAPTVQEHIQKNLIVVDSTIPPSNRWDAKPLDDLAVDNEEWDD